jgi:phosphatidylglycerophosphate synthase
MWLLRKLTTSGITPNQVSVLGMIFGVSAGGLLALTPTLELGGMLQRILLFSSVVLVILRGACNIFDGVLAVETGRASRVGLLYNEVPDRISDIGILIGAGYAIGSHPTLGWAAALGSLATAYVRVQVQLAGSSPDYSGPMAKPARMAVLCLALGVLALLPLAWWPSSSSGQGIGLIGGSLVIITLGTLVTAIIRLRHAFVELLPNDHHDPQ